MTGPTAPAAGGERPHPKPHLLLAEDNEFLRSFLDEILQPAYVVESVASAAQAWAAAQRQRPDLILSDVIRLGGLDLTRRLRADPRTARVPIVLLTANSLAQTKTDALAAGADAFLQKPFHLEELLTSLSRCCPCAGDRAFSGL